MTGSKENDWFLITGLISELKACDEAGLVTASLAMSFVCIDTLTNLGRSEEKARVTRKDFQDWVDKYLKGHADQTYQYRGKDVYAARCAFLHTYGSKAEIHNKDPDILIYGYHNGGRHALDRSIDERMVVIGTRSFVNDVICAANSFMKDCKSDLDLRKRVESRLDGVLGYSSIK